MQLVDTSIRLNLCLSNWLTLPLCSCFFTPRLSGAGFRADQ